MSDTSQKLEMSRRPFLKAAGLGGLLAGLPAAAQASASRAPILDFEKANEDLVNNFCWDWAKRDVEVLIPYLSEKIDYMIFEGGPIINGHDEFRKNISSLMSSAAEIKWDIHRSYTMGDVVINERTDYFNLKDGTVLPASPYHVLGVFLVRDNKIQVWKDYGIRGGETGYFKSDKLLWEPSQKG